MKGIESKLRVNTVDLAEPASEAFQKAFPYLVPGVLRRGHSTAELKERALWEIWNMAVLALKSQHCPYNDGLVADLIEEFVQRVFGLGALENYNSGDGDMDGYLFGIMRNIFRELMRDRVRRRIDKRKDVSLLSDIKPEPGTDAQRRELMANLRQWTIELRPSERNAIGRKYEALADLDTGDDIPNEALARHRGLNRLREKAKLFYGDVNTG